LMASPCREQWMSRGGDGGDNDPLAQCPKGIQQFAGQGSPTSVSLSPSEVVGKCHTTQPGGSEAALLPRVRTSPWDIGPRSGWPLYICLPSIWSG
jgi:hypothetical protein